MRRERGRESEVGALSPISLEVTVLLNFPALKFQ